MPKRNRHTGARSRKQRRVRGFRPVVECLESRTVLSAMVMPAYFAPERELAVDFAARPFDSPQLGAIIGEAGMRISADLGHDSRWLEQTPLPAPGPVPLDFAFDNVGFRAGEMAPFESRGFDSAFGRENLGSASSGQRDNGLFESLPRYDRGPVEDAFRDTPPDRDYLYTNFTASTYSWQSSLYSVPAWSSLQSLDQAPRALSTVMTGVLHFEIVVQPIDLLFSLLTINTFAEPQRGLVSLSSQTAETGLPRLGTFAASRARASAPSENAPLRSTFAADSFDTIGSRATGQLLRDPGRQLTFNLLLENPYAATDASSGEEEGSLRLSADQIMTISNWIGSVTIDSAPRGVLSAGSGFERIEPRLSESRSELMQTDWYDLETGLRSSVSLQMAGIAGDKEGGMIDIGAERETYSFLHDPELTPSHEATGRPTSQRAANEYAEQRGTSNELRRDINSAETISTDATVLSQETDRGESKASHTTAIDQGGMIALASSPISASGVFLAESGVSATVQSAAGLTMASAGNGDVQMDAGIGLYHVFELATGPGQLDDQTVTSNRTATGQTPPQASSPAKPAAAGRQSEGQPQANNDGFGDMLLRLAATIPAVLFLASLPIRRIAWRRPAKRMADRIRLLTKRYFRPRS